MTDFTDANWRKSVRSQNNGACVEVARVGDVIGIRDSKNPNGPTLTVDAHRLVSAAKDGVLGE